MKHRVLKIVLVLLAALAVAAVGTVAINHFTKRTSESGVQVVIQVGKDGFNPSVMTVRSGTTVTWTNIDNKAHRITSTPYPAHSDLPALESQQNIGPGNSYSYTFTKQGSFGFLDYLYPEHDGKIIVK